MAACRLIHHAEGLATPMSDSRRDSLHRFGSDARRQNQWAFVLFVLIGLGVTCGVQRREFGALAR